MSKTPTLEEIVQAVDALALRKRKRAPQGRKAKYPDNFIIALTVYQKLSGFRYAQQLLAVLASLKQDVPAPSTFAEREAGLMGRLILAVKQLCSDVRAMMKLSGYLALRPCGALLRFLNAKASTACTISSRVGVLLTHYFNPLQSRAPSGLTKQAFSQK